MRGATRSCLVTGSSPLLLFLRQHHPQGEETHDRAVAEVAEHHGEQEGERDDGVRGCRCQKKNKKTKHIDDDTRC